MLSARAGPSLHPSLLRHSHSQQGPSVATTHCHVTDPSLTLLGLAPADVHKPDRWLLRELNGNLRLETLSNTPQGASALAVHLLSGETGLSLTWARLRAQGYRIVRPIGPYFHPEPPSEYWGRQPRYGLWQTHALVWVESPDGIPATPSVGR
jgi:hypothetical protein